MPDPVNPEHYKTSVSPLEVIEATQPPSAVHDFCIGNALKYIMRHTKKHGGQDLRKAVWYLVYALTKDKALCEELTTRIVDSTEPRAVANV